MICPICQEDVETYGGKFQHHGECSGGFAYTDKAHEFGEDRYTPPTDWCPHPERWHADDWDSAELEVSNLVAAFTQAVRPEVAIETGTAWGQTAALMGEQLVGYGRLITYEVVIERVEAARAKCKDLPVEVRYESSLDSLDPWKETSLGPIGFAWFDSLLPLRVPEFRHFYPVMAPGAVVGFHDTNNDQLWQDITQLEGEGLLLPMRLRTPRGVVFGEVIR